MTIQNKEDVISEYYKCNKNMSETARKLGISRRTVKRYLDSCKEQNNSTIEQDNIVNIKSTSTLFDKDGKIVQKWVKADTSKNAIKKAIKAFIDEYSKKIPQYKPAKKEPYDTKDSLVVYPLADVHLGMLSWKPETGVDYDTEIAENTVRETVTKIMSITPACDECIIANLGDFFHVDNQVHQTERSGNTLDVDSRYARLIRVGLKLMRYMIEYALQKHKKVTVVNCMGNHDDLSGLWMDECLLHIYEKESRLKILSEPTYRHYYKYGNNLIGFTHGNDIKIQNLPIIMASEKKDLWGETDNHYWLTGHIHQDKVIEVGDCKVESLRAVCAKDAYSVSRAYMSGRDIKAILYHRDQGECARITVKI